MVPDSEHQVLQTRALLVGLTCASQAATGFHIYQAMHAPATPFRQIGQRSAMKFLNLPLAFC